MEPQKSLVLSGLEIDRALAALAWRSTVGQSDKKGHNSKFESQEKALHTTIIRHNLTKVLYRLSSIGSFC